MVYVLSGLYGAPSDLGLGVVFILIFQLVRASMIVILLSGVLQKGYGIATNICKGIVWKPLSSMAISTVRGPNTRTPLSSWFITLNHAEQNPTSPAKTVHRSFKL